MCYPLGLINSHCFSFHTYFIPKPNSLTNNANFFITASMKTSGDHYRNDQDDRNAQFQDLVYTTSNGVPMPHPYETQRVGPLLLQDLHLIDLILTVSVSLNELSTPRAALPMEFTK
jgi:hypothetical protein